MSDGLQWRIYHADLDPIIGREQAGERPVLVISAEPLNERYDVVMVVPLTSRKSGRPARLGEVLLRSGTAGLPMESMALCYQIRAIDKRRLGACYGVVSDPELRAEIAATTEDCLDLPYL